MQMTKKRSIILASVVMISMIILIIGYLISSSGKKTEQVPETVNAANDSITEPNEQITEEITDSVSEDMEAEYIQLLVWKEGSGSELLGSDKVFLFRDYSNDEYRTMVAAASYGRSSAGKYIILEYYEADRGMLGYMVRIRESAE